ncbi:MAG: hypothetical protein HN542_07685 [Flavobacteriales bacterium]|nr:hypothetical protein [Flavobacteriales bacterium]MBT4704358.1 hypothetical protein [Flavobacteriales bacterium]MBT4930486.1 hypothetical protein [Flavobacteriales bacterium]MBT5131762.1 hypothetical protein [Flavobacteriales bacterium]MBT5977797.1 hypothetical protein [Flavobacteriales bacterium]
MRRLNIFLVLILGLFQSLSAQKPFEGKVSFLITYQEFPEGKEAMEHVLPNEATWFISGADTRVESATEVGGETTSLYVSNQDSITVLFKLTGQSVFYRRMKNQPVKFRVAPKQKTMTWNDIVLTRHVLQSADGLIVEAWCDTRYQNTSGTGYDDLMFLPLIFDFQDRGVRMRYTASSMDVYPIDETYFKIPEDRVRVSSHTLQKIVR